MLHRSRRLHYFTDESSETARPGFLPRGGKLAAGLVGESGYENRQAVADQIIELRAVAVFPVERVEAGIARASGSEGALDAAGGERLPEFGIGLIDTRPGDEVFGFDAAGDEAVEAGCAVDGRSDGEVRVLAVDVDRLVVGVGDQEDAERFLSSSRMAPDFTAQASAASSVGGLNVVSFVPVLSLRDWNSASV